MTENEKRHVLKGIIYKIQNKIDGKSYIGQTNSTFHGRYIKEWWKDKDLSKYLKSAINKYGIENFSVQILEFNKNQSELDSLEDYCVELYNSLTPNGYNLTSGGKSKFKHSDESRERSSEAKRKKTYIFISPNGEEFIVNNLSKFAREHGLKPSPLTLLGKYGCRTYKGWSVPDFPPKTKFIKSPEGVIYEIKYGTLDKFCKERDLVTECLSRVLRKNCKSYKGWTLPETEIDVKNFKSPSGEIFEVKKWGLTKFAKQHNLDAACLGRVWSGDKKYSHHKGWTRAV
jgi:hypothetical protein